MKSRRTLLVEGWRNIAHSYAVVNQFQLLEFLKEPNLTLRHRDVRYHNKDWQPRTGLFDQSSQKLIKDIPQPIEGEKPDAVYRIAFPYNISPSEARRTVVFGTSEFQCVAPNYITGNRSLVDACQECDAAIVTPSNWSRAGFLESGADPDRVHVVPHGINPAIFRPLPPEQRTALRTERKLSGFVFLTLGAMTGNKRMDALLKAFAAVAQKHPDVRMLMKGIASLYPSRKLLQSQTTSLTQSEAHLIQPKITYFDQTLSFAEMANLYQAADAYVSPYSAEGFNLPVLEAIACGLPVICTSGGPTDDFTKGDFALCINATRVRAMRPPDSTGYAMQVNFDHLVHQMMTAVESPDLAERARTAGPAFVASGFTWHHVTQKLLRVLFDPDDF